MRFARTLKAGRSTDAAYWASGAKPGATGKLAESPTRLPPPYAYEAENRYTV
jgi:hypothetical protein